MFRLFPAQLGVRYATLRKELPSFLLQQIVLNAVEKQTPFSRWDPGPQTRENERVRLESNVSIQMTRFKMNAYSIFLLDFGLASTIFAQCFLLNFGEICLPFVSQSVKAWEPRLRMKNLLVIRVLVKFVKPIYFLFHLVGEKWGSRCL